MRSNCAVCMLVHMWNHTHHQPVIMMTQEVPPYKKDLWHRRRGRGISVSARHQHTGKTTSHIHSTCSFCISRRALFYKDVVTVVKVLIVPLSSFSYMLSPCDKQRPPKSNSKNWVVKQDNSRRRINSASYWSPVQQINMGRA